MLGFLSEYEVFYDVLGFANFVLNEFATQAGPINKNCKSSKNDGFLPSTATPGASNEVSVLKTNE